jgi:hypothetical protein
MRNRSEPVFTKRLVNLSGHTREKRQGDRCRSPCL